MPSLREASLSVQNTWTQTQTQTQTLLQGSQGWALVPLNPREKKTQLCATSERLWALRYPKHLCCGDISHKTPLQPTPDHPGPNINQTSTPNTQPLTTTSSPSKLRCSSNHTTPTMPPQQLPQPSSMSTLPNHPDPPILPGTPGPEPNSGPNRCFWTETRSFVTVRPCWQTPQPALVPMT